MNPVTTGGRISGRCTRPLRMDLPQNLPRASNQPTAMPKGRLTSIATDAMRRVRWTAVHSSLVSENQFKMSGPHPDQSAPGP